MSQADTSANNKRMAKNTLMLYLRMFFTMGISLYTSRVILQALGVEDFGIYNVVGGIITMFSFINSAMVAATQRYLNFEIGTGDINQLKKVFSTALQIHVLISLAIVLLAETVGLWFFYEKMVIPQDRVNAAFWVYQCSIIACVINIISAPYNADIIAHEKMSAFAYISVLEVSLKLIIVYLLFYIPGDKLIVYASLILCIQLLIRYVYTHYCSKHFEESHYCRGFDKTLFKNMLGFAGWSFFGGFSVFCCNQGVNLLMNTFFGPLVNAAQGIAQNVQNAVTSFANNFQIATRPQIIKTYAEGNFEAHRNLVTASSKYSALLLIIISIPIFLETREILSLWLGQVPEYTINFIRIMLLISIWDSTLSPLATSIQATGRIRTYQIIISFVIFLVLPLSYIVFQFYLIPELALIIHLVMAVLAQFVRLYFLHRYINLNIFNYVKVVYLPLIISFVVSLVVSYILFLNVKSGISKLIYVTIFSIPFSTLVIYIFALTTKEKDFVKLMLKKIYNKIPSLNRLSQ